MNIPTIEITDEELAQAITCWIKSNGFSFPHPVEEVKKQYSYSDKWQVIFAEPAKPTPPPEPEMVDELPQKI